LHIRPKQIMQICNRMQQLLHSYANIDSVIETGM
jgi:hypothetical protein